MQLRRLLQAGGFSLALLGADFEVATLKRSPPPLTDSYPITLGTLQNGKVEFKNASLSDCLKFAYGLVADDQISGPDWIKSKSVMFDIVGKSSPRTSREEAAAMVQALLIERLKLKTHTERKEMRYLALVQDKKGSKMTPAASDAVRDNSGGNGHIKGNQVSMLLLATLLSRLEHQIVVDQTGLNGAFQVKLQWTPDSGRPDVTTDDAAPARNSLFTAIQEQLGLRLESRKGPLDVLVIDHAEQAPAEN